MRARAIVVCLVAVLVAACTDEGLVRPVDDGVLTPNPPSFAIRDAGNNGGTPGFWFLPPLAKQVATEGTFDPNLMPGMEVCLLSGNPHPNNPVDCTGDPVKTFEPGSADVGDGLYAFSWKTKRKGEMDSDEFYRIKIFLEEDDVENTRTVLGYLDVNPQNPSGESPGEDYPDLYAFRLGETLPVKVFLNPQARCALTEDYVTQCTASAVIDNEGAVVTLETEGWFTLSVVVPATALPEGYPQVTLTMERIDSDLFFEVTGERCIPIFDAPLFGDCLRVTTDPVIEDPLEPGALATIEMCIDPTVADSLGLLKFDEEQDTRLQIIRFDGIVGIDGVWQGLPNVDATTCGPPSSSFAGLLPVPDEGLFRYAALGVNKVARFLGPEPVGAHGPIRLAGATSKFSRFRWGLPGQMTIVAGDGELIQQQEGPVPPNYPVTVTVQVVDAGSPFPESGDPLPPSGVKGATVHFSNGVDVVTADEEDADGLATTTWAVPSAPGDHTLTATALGLLDISVDDHGSQIDFTEATVTFTATVVGPPSQFEQSPDSLPPLTGTPGGTLTATPLVITVFDENGLPVNGWDVVWDTDCGGFECDPGSVEGETPETGTDGSATGLWTLSTTPGSNTATATVGSVTATWYANGVCIVTVDGTMAPGEWDCAVAVGDTGSFFANISGGETPAEVLWQNDGDNLYLAVKVQQSSLAKANSIRFDFDNEFDGPTAGDDAIAYDADSGEFSDEHLTQRCVNRSQSGCGSLDREGQDGAGAMDNDGTWTVYELSHPLTGDEGDEGEDFAVGPGDILGFFLTLRSGNGAQGNTQFPGFRIFESITIH